MKHLVLALALLCTACGTTGSTLWGPVKNCAGNYAKDAVAEVQQALLSDGPNMDAVLEQIAATYGYEVVSCIIRDFINQGLATMQEVPPARIEAAKRGQDFLKRKGVTFN